MHKSAHKMALSLSSIASNLLRSVRRLEMSEARGYSIAASKLVYAEYGDPVKVIERCDESIGSEVKPNEVVIRMLAAPVNPADINTIEGKYPIKPSLPAVPGNEGVGEIISVGSAVQSVAVGDRVVPLTNALGTWRTHAVFSDDSVFKIPKCLGLVEAATLTVNPCTAYRMLKDFVDLQPGDTVIQNGGNSACGQNIIQMCRAWGVQTVNIVRNRPEIAQLKEQLCKLGGTHVLTEEELRSTDLFRSNTLKKPKLGLNCVGGKSALELLRHLDKCGTMVTYGGMSRDPVTVPTSALIFKDVRVVGFWMTEWNRSRHGSPQRLAMLEEIVCMMSDGRIRGPAYAMVPFSDYKQALKNAMTMSGMLGKKFILDFQS